MKSKLEKITSVISFSFLLSFPLTNSFGEATVDIHGKIKSYNEGIYQIQTDQSLINVECSKLLQAYQQFTTGQQVHITIPTSAVLSYREVISSNRTPASRAPVRAPASVIHQKIGVGR